MDFGLEPDQAEFLEGVRRFLDERFPGSAETAPLGTSDRSSPNSFYSYEHTRELNESLGFTEHLRQRGLLGVGWPREYGGGGRTAVEQWLFLEEMAHRRLPTFGLTFTSVGPTLMRIGTEEQRRTYLPAILRGELEFGLGYTEPGAGTDLAAIATTAVRDGDDYVITGQKQFTTAAHYATHMWLAARTGPPESRHRGLSLFIVPMDTPGIAVRPLQTQADLRTNEVFYDGVRVPAANLVGEENGGWRVMMMALDFERIHPYAGLLRDFEDLVGWAREAPAGDGVVLDDPVVRQTLARLAADLEIARLLTMRTAVLIDEGAVPNAEAAMAKVWISELRKRVASQGLGIVGEAGQQRVRTPGAPAGGSLEELFRYFPVLTFGAGNNEVLKNVIAQRGLGLPRE
jgi:alkylation response protein AidB-like acyl-CoA dehydrogenase